MNTVSKVKSIVDLMVAVAMLAAAVIIVWKVVVVPPSGGPAAKGGRGVVGELPLRPVSAANAQIEGRATAPIGIIMFSDFQCPFCGRFVRETLPRLRRAFVEPGRAFIAFMHYPLERIHPDAFSAAVVAECASQAGRFWQLHDRLFEPPRPLLTNEALIAAARDVDLDVGRLEQCRSSEGPDQVRIDMRIASSLGVRSTPSFFVGLRIADGSVKVTNRFSGARLFEDFDELLSGLETSK
jgi:protein-disulfide isomerase